MHLTQHCIVVFPLVVSGVSILVRLGRSFSLRQSFEARAHDATWGALRGLI